MRLLSFAFLLTSLILPAHATELDIPDALAPWQGWVLFPHEDIHCLHEHNTNQPRICAWPDRLNLDLGQTEGQFEQNWEVYAESWIRLPGSNQYWPQEVMVNDQPASVVSRKGLPALHLKKGQYQISGKLLWDRMPEQLRIPPETGLINLQINGRTISNPNISQRGQLWLQSQEQQERAEDSNSLDVQVFRLVEDGLPQKVTTQINLTISGKTREIRLEDVLPEGFTALRLTSQLPAKLNDDDSLQVQLRPGRWTISIQARSDQEINPIILQEHAEPWPEQEVWVFQARQDLRQVELTGLTRIDPRQTRLPPQWQQLPAFRVLPGEGMGFKLIRRGAEKTFQDQLSLQRQLWLDFNGEGYTLQDNINGQVRNTWRLSTQSDLKLGQVKINNQPQFITRLPGDAQDGIEIRRGNLNLQADSRYTQDLKDLPANGWNLDFQSVEATLHLPPGWRLFSATGVDNVPRTWVQRWSLLDIFLVLIAAIASARLFGPVWGGVVLLTLTLSWHEPGAPQYSWLNLLAAIALIRLLPKGKIRRLLQIYRGFALILIILIGLPFIVNEVRTGIYPQLENPWSVSYASPVRSLPSSVAQVAEDVAMEAGVVEKSISRSEPKSYYRKKQSLDEIDPNALVQTGPGLPDWKWNSIPLRWNGPVAQGQEMHLALIPPLAVSAIKMFLSLLLVVVAWRLSDTGKLHLPRLNGTHAAILLAPLLATGLVDKPAQAGQWPSPEILEQLEQRLLRADRCLPECAQIANAQLDLNENVLTLKLEVHADTDVAIPVPGHAMGWTPAMVEMDGKPAGLMYRSAQDVLWIPARAGVQHIALAAPLPPGDRHQLHFPLRPKRIDVVAEGWTVVGLLDDGRMEPSLELIRQQSSTGGDAKPDEIQPTPLPGFAQLRRTLHLGLDWHVSTTVIRATPADSSFILELPLLDGESVTTPGVQVEDGYVQVSMPPGERQFSWESRLEKQEQIRLAASSSLQPGQTSWIETWQLDVSPVWHVQFSGIPVIHQADASGQWLPEWRPWPGEEVLVKVIRPEGVAGQTLTIDHSKLTSTPGKRSSEHSLELSLRSSQGGQHVLGLPEDAVLQEATIDGRSRNLNIEQGKLVLPIEPGSHKVRLTWRQEAGHATWFNTPSVYLGTPAVNTNLLVKQGTDRWVLFTGGPRLGPAVLFWGIVLVLVLISLGLGLIKLTPLKTWQWFLLLIGLSQTPVWLGLVVVGWLLILGARNRLETPIDPGIHNAMQLGIALFTLVAITSLFIAVKQGLLGLPEMQISGNGSSASQLKWYLDRTDGQMPEAWIMSLPLLAYRLLMLAWALWLAFSLLNWLRWGWQSMNVGGLWHNIPKKPRKPRGTRRAKKDDADNVE